MAGPLRRPGGLSTTSFAKYTLLQVRLQNVWHLQSSAYRVLQEELRSHEHIPGFSALLGDWEPQQLGSDSHSRVQLDYGRAGTAAHGLVLPLE